LYLTIRTPFTVDIHSTPILCHGDSSSVFVSASGGVEPYSGTGIFRYSAGNYQLTITDAAGCVVTEAITILEPPSISIVATTTPAYRGADGTATASAYGGTAPYRYSWNTIPLQTTATATSLSAGSYIVTVTDANGCTEQSSVTVQSNGEVECPNAFKTYGQGAWGAPANGNNTGIYLNAHFASAYPNGLKIGDCGRFILLTSSTAVRNFLPSGSAPRQLNAGILTNPSRQIYTNVFAGHLVSLNLNMTFDSLDAAFGNSSSLVKNATIKSGMFTGWTVQQLYNEANRVIGCGGSNSYINALKDAVEDINESWEGGQKSNDYLNCPAGNSFADNQSNSELYNYDANVSVYPNPARDKVQIGYMMSGAGEAFIQIYNAQGALLGTRSVKHNTPGKYHYELAIKGRGWSAGVYTLQINRNGKMDRVRVVVE
jgi:hypothetical protein